MRFPMLAFLLIGVALCSSAAAEELRIDELIVAKPMPADQLKSTLKAIRAFYRFWNTGDKSLLTIALAPGFTDRTLPPGRPQGPGGPAFASEHFRAAVPDLHVDVRKVLITNDYVTVHMEFMGHFSGTFGQTKGGGQPIKFIATDLLKVSDGRITDNWHIEDNLTLLMQMGVAKIEQ